MIGEIDANTPIEHERINRKSQRMSRSTNHEGNTSSEEDRRNTSDMSSRSSGEKETLEKGMNPPNKAGKFNAFKK